MPLSPVVRPPTAYPKPFVDRVRAALPRAARPVGDVVTSADLAGLPEAARRYLRFAGAVGRPRDRVLRARFVGRFRLRPRGPWVRCEAWQYTTAQPAARLFRIRLHRPGGPPVTGWDTYRDGRGGVRATMLGVLPVANGAGPRFDAAAQVTWLVEVLLLAPSMLAQAAVRWSGGANADTFRVSFTDAGRTVEAEALVAPDGALREVRTDDRWAQLPGGGVRARWSAPVDGWRTVGGRPRITEAHAVWQLPGGPFPYAELVPTDIGYDVGPGGEPWNRTRPADRRY